jgi:hypothetical protein
MKKLYILLLALLIMGISPACVKATPGSLGQELNLQIGQTVRLASENMQLTFREVTEDSRCPSGVVCIWAGRATSLLKIVYGDAVYYVSLTEMGGGQVVTQDFLNYKIAFNLQPYPAAGKTISTSDYRLTLIITK